MTRNCVICGIEFDSRHARSVCCGDDCRAKRTVENWKAASARAVAERKRRRAERERALAKERLTAPPPTVALLQAIPDLTARIERIETTLHNLCDALGMPR